MEQLSDEQTILTYNVVITNKNIDLLVIEPGFYHYPVLGERVTVKIIAHKDSNLTVEDIILEVAEDSIIFMLGKMGIAYEVELYYDAELHDKIHIGRLRD
jgi:hypothetical protein